LPLLKFQPLYIPLISLSEIHRTFYSRGYNSQFVNCNQGLKRRNQTQILFR